jgi:hypothetical protein
MSFPRFPISALFVGVLASLASACGGATESALLAASYDLVSYEGQTLPVTTHRLVYNSTEPGGPSYTCDDRLTGMNLRFVTSNSYTQNESRLLVCDDGRPDASSSSVIQGTYELGEGTLELIADLGGGFFQQGFARFSGDGLTVYRREIRSGTLTTVNGAPLVFLATP